MKKAVLILILVLVMVSTVLAGTLANYTVTLDDIASGSVIGKEFIFLEDGTDTFQHDIKIAPTETVTWQFAVKNFDGSFVTETNMYYDLTFDVHATANKSAIDPLVVTVKDSNGDAVNSVTGVGTLHVTGSFPLSAQGQSDSYTVDIYWPSNNEIDINYAGGNYGTTVNVSAVGSQVSGGDEEDPPEGGGDEEEPPEGGGDEEEPQVNSDITALYQTNTPWMYNGHWDAEAGANVGGTWQHNFNITITNNTDQDINGWQLDFLLAEDIYSYDNSVMVYDSQTGIYHFSNPANWNKIIPAHGSLEFAGLAQGWAPDEPSGNNPISAVTLNGELIALDNQYQSY